MITGLRVKNYKALKEVSLQLTRLHVLIGPNDSGKTSILEALYALCTSVDFPLQQAFPGRWKAAELVWEQDPQRDVSLAVDLSGDANTNFYGLTCRFKSERQVYKVGERLGALPIDEHQSGETAVYALRNSPADPRYPIVSQVHEDLSGVQLYRWIPRHLAYPVAQGDQPPFHMEPSGFGLVRCLEDILGDSRQRFEEIEKRFKEFFPEYRSIKLRRETAYRSHVDQWGEAMFKEQPGKGLYFELSTHGIDLPASQASDGVLLVLAYITLLNLPRRPRVLLIEEPENGIYPKRLKEVLAILRTLVEAQTHTQVVFTTHSPYVLDFFSPQEVTLCRKGKDGAISTTSLSKSKAVQEQIDVFTLGEIWTAEGEDRLAEPSHSDEVAPR